MASNTPSAPLAGGTSPAGAAAFAGRWSMTRDIIHGDGLTGRLVGEAVIAPTGPGLWRYSESGELTLGASEPFRATRDYLWRAAEKAIDVSFADGRPFHRIELSALTPATVHLCDPDRYAVAYDFTLWPEWSARWQVEGPRKDYTMTTTYRPAP